MKNNTTILASLGVLVLALVVYGAWYVLTRTDVVVSDGNEEGIVCTADAQQCPDGSWVGRSGPDCSFVCPASTSTDQGRQEVTLETTFDRSISGLDVKVTPLLLLEDSRCPIDVQCIQAGTVRIRALLESGLGSGPQVFVLGAPITTEAETVTLIAVRPDPKAGKTIGSAEYTFVFRITKR
jgi:hypothetical protein